MARSGPQDTTDLPFSHALGHLVAQRGLTWRRLADMVSEATPGSGLNHSYLNRLATGHVQIAKPETLIATIEAVAKGLGLPPSYFREYREHLAAQEARRLASEIGLAPVLEALQRLDPQAKASSRAPKAPRPKATPGPTAAGRRRGKPDPS